MIFFSTKYTSEVRREMYEGVGEKPKIWQPLLEESI